MKVSKQLILYMYIEFILCFIFFIFSILVCKRFIFLYNAECVIGILVILNFILYYFLLLKIKIEILSLSSYFVTFMYLFNLGIPVCRLMNWVNSRGEEALNLRIYSMGIENYIGYLLYAFLLITMLQLGILYYYSKHRENTRTIYKTGSDYNSALIKCKKTGYICVFLGIIPYLINEFIYISDAFKWKYQSEYSTNMSGSGIGLIGNLFLLGYIMILYSNQNNKIRFDFMFCLLVIYQLFRMYITGDRSTGITLILVLIMIRNRFISRIKGRKLIKYSILGIVTLYFLKIIETIRQTKTFIPKNIFQILPLKNMIGNTFFDFSTNVWSGMMVRYCMRQNPDYRYGLTYIAAIIGKPLSILKITDTVWQYGAFSNYINSPERDHLISVIKNAMGGSFSGEIYFNFGWFGIIIVFWIGYILAMISKISIDGIHANPTVSAFLLYINSSIIWWTRQYFTSVSWHLVFYGLTIFILYHVINNKNYWG